MIIAFLREIKEQNGFWSPINETIVGLEHIQIIGICNPPTDIGTHSLNNRFLCHCPLLYVDFQDGSML